MDGLTIIHYMKSLERENKKLKAKQKSIEGSNAYTVLVIWNDDTEMQPFVFSNIDKMIEFRDEALEDPSIKEVKCYITTIK